MSPTARVIAVVAALLLLVACGQDEEDGGAPPEDDGETQAPEGPEDAPEVEAGEEREPEPQPDEEETEQGEGNGEDDQWVTVFVLRDVDGYLWVESEQRRLAEATEAVAGAAMRELFGVPPTDPGLEAPVLATVEVLDVVLEDGLLVVDVSEAIRDGARGAAGEGMFRQTLAHSGAQFDTVDAVELRVEGEEIAELWGHIDWSEPATPDPYARSPVDVERPRYGETLSAGPITVSGTSLTFESTVELDLLDPGGAVVEETFTTAAQPDVDQRGPFEHTFETEATEPGTWTIRVREPDPSDGEGRPPYTADIEFTVE